LGGVFIIGPFWPGIALRYQLDKIGIVNVAQRDLVRKNLIGQSFSFMVCITT